MYIGGMHKVAATSITELQSIGVGRTLMANECGGLITNIALLNFLATCLVMVDAMVFLITESAERGVLELAFVAMNRRWVLVAVRARHFSKFCLNE